MPTISKPKKTTGKIVVLLSESLNLSEASMVTNVAKASDCALDLMLIKKNDRTWFFLSQENAPSPGQYLIDRKGWDGKAWQGLKLDWGNLEDQKKWHDAQWHQRLHVNKNVAAVAKGGMLAFHIYHSWNHIVLQAAYDDEKITAQVARLKKPQIANVLRKEKAA